MRRFPRAKKSPRNRSCKRSISGCGSRRPSSTALGINRSRNLPEPVARRVINQSIANSGIVSRFLRAFQLESDARPHWLLEKGRHRPAPQRKKTSRDATPKGWRFAPHLSFRADYCATAARPLCDSSQVFRIAEVANERLIGINPTVEPVVTGKSNSCGPNHKARSDESLSLRPLRSVDGIVLRSSEDPQPSPKRGPDAGVRLSAQLPAI